jgi:hypothetical protein
LKRSLVKKKRYSEANCLIKRYRVYMTTNIILAELETYRGRPLALWRTCASNTAVLIFRDIIEKMPHS